MKKTFKVLSFIFAIVLLVTLGCVATFAADGDVAYIGETGYATLADAIASAGDGDTITLADGTHKWNAAWKVQNKAVTFEGSDKAIIDMVNVGTGQNTSGATLIFNGLTVQFGTANYKGFQHAAKVVYNNVTHIGQEFLYAPVVEFNGVTFNVSGNVYAVWTYGAKDVTFADCEFNTDGKAVLVYTEGNHAAEINLADCTFNATTNRGKAAVEVGQSGNAGAKAEYALSFNNCTADDNFSSASDGIETGSNLFGDKNNMAAVSGMGVFVDDAPVYGTAVKNITTGEVYISLADAAAAANAGDTIQLLKDVSFDTHVWLKDINLDLNGKTLTYIGSSYGISTLPVTKSVTISDGKIVAAGAANAGINAYGVILDNVIIDNSGVTGNMSFCLIMHCGTAQLLNGTELIVSEKLTAPVKYNCAIRYIGNVGDGTHVTVDVDDATIGGDIVINGQADLVDYNLDLSADAVVDGKFIFTDSANKAYTSANLAVTAADEAQLISIGCVATVNNIGYVTFSDAVNKALNAKDAKIILIADIDDAIGFQMSQRDGADWRTIEIDLNGFDLNFAQDFCPFESDGVTPRDDKIFRTYYGNTLILSNSKATGGNVTVSKGGTVATFVQLIGGNFTVKDNVTIYGGNIIGWPAENEMGKIIYVNAGQFQLLDEASLIDDGCYSMIWYALNADANGIKSDLLINTDGIVSGYIDVQPGNAAEATRINSVISIEKVGGGSWIDVDVKTTLNLKVSEAAMDYLNEVDAVAEANGVYFASLADAVAAAPAGSTVTLLDNDYSDSKLSIGKDLVIDLNGHGYFLYSEGWTTAIYIEPGFRGPSHPEYDAEIGKGEGYYVSPNVTIKNGVVHTWGTAPAIQSFGNLTLEDVQITSVKNGVSIQAGNNQILGNTSITAPGVYALMFQATSNDYNEGTQLLIDTTGTITGVIQFQLQGGGTTDENNALTINNMRHEGTFSGTASADWTEADIYGGNYEDLAVVNYLADGYTYVMVDGRIVVVKGSEVLGMANAKLNDVYYATLAEAVAAAKDGETVYLLQDFTGEGFTFNTDITIDLGGHTFYNTSRIYMWSEGFKATIKNGDIAPVAGNNQAILYYAAGTLTLDNVDIKGDYVEGNAYLLTIQGAGDVILTGGTSIYAHYDLGKAVDGKNAIHINLDDGGKVNVIFEDVWTISGGIAFWPSVNGSMNLDIRSISGVWNANFVYHSTIQTESVNFKVTGAYAAMTVGTIHLMPGGNLTYIDKNAKEWVVTAPTWAQGNHNDLAIDYYPEYDRYAVGVISYTTLDAIKMYGTDQWFEGDSLNGTKLDGAGSYEFKYYKNTFGFVVAGDNHHDHFVPTPATRTEENGVSYLYENIISDGKHYLNFLITHISATSVYTIDQSNFIIDDDGATLTWTDEYGTKHTQTYTGAGTIIITQAPITDNYADYNGDFDYDGKAHTGQYPTVKDFAFSTQSKGNDGPIKVLYTTTEPADPTDIAYYSELIPSVTNFTDNTTVWYIAYDTGYGNYSPACGTYTLTINKLDITNAEFELIVDQLVYDATEQSVSILYNEVILTVGDQTFVLFEGEDYTISGNKGTNAGDYTFTITAVADSNYDLFATRDWNIAQRELYVVPYNNTVVYGHEYKELAVAWNYFHTYESAEWLATVAPEFVTLDDLLTTATDYVVGDGVDVIRNISVVYAEGKSAADHPNYNLILGTAEFAEAFGMENVDEYFGILTILPDADVDPDFEAIFNKLIFNGQIQQPTLSSLIVTKYDFNTTDDIIGEVIDLDMVAIEEVENWHAGTYAVVLTITGGNYEGAVLNTKYTITPMVIDKVEWIFAEEGYTFNYEHQAPEAIAYGPNDTILTLSTTQNIFVGDYWSYVQDIIEISNEEHLPTDYVLDLLSIRVASYEIKEAAAVKFESAFVAIGDTYALNFNMPKIVLDQYNLTADDADELFEVFYNGSHKFAAAGEYTFELVGKEYILTYAQIAPSNMGKTVTVTPTFGKDPKAITYSIEQYCKDMLAIYDGAAKEGNLYYDFVKMLLSMLNYGHAAEVYATGSSALVDDISDETLKKYGIERALDTIPGGEGNTDATFKYYTISDEYIGLNPVLTPGASSNGLSLKLDFTAVGALVGNDIKVGFVDRDTKVETWVTIAAGDATTATFNITLANADHNFRILICDENGKAGCVSYMDISILEISSANSENMNQKMAEFSIALSAYLANLE